MGSGYRLRTLAFLLATLAWAASASDADAVCRWRVSSTIEGVLPGVPPLPGRVWPVANMEVRVQARTPGGLWNTVNWPATRTNASGTFSVTSAIVFLDPDCQQTREFRVQIRGFETGYNWRNVHHGSAPGPNNMGGPATPAPTHAVVIGNIYCDEDECRGGIIRVEGLQEPPVDLRPGNNDDDDRRNPQIAEAPCGLRMAQFTQGVEFRFGQMPATPGPLSPDQALRFATRARANGEMTLNRLSQHIHVENAGSRDYVRNPRCAAMVQFRLNEGPGQRGEGENAWSTPLAASIPDVAVNASAPVSVGGNLLGAGDVLVGEWDEDWEYALVEVTLDATHAVPESAETDNRIVHCYHAPSNSFAAMSMCEEASE